MRSFWSRRLKQGLLWFRNKLAGGVLILLYHRVNELATDPHLLNVTPKHFSEHLEVLQKNYRILQLEQLIQVLKKKVPSRAIVVTFDDGYADNLYNAKPLLERYGIPATIFITTGYMNQKREFWWDELERVLLYPGIVPRVLRLNINGSDYEWELGESANYSDQDFNWHRGYNILENNNFSKRQHIYHSVYNLIQPLTKDKRQEVLDDLLRQAGLERIVRLSYRTLTSNEILKLAEGKLIDIGSHTVTHPWISKLSDTAQREEIRESKNHLEQILGHPVNSFAYPYGSKTHYSTQVVRIIKEIGFNCACSVFNGIAHRFIDPFQLPRFSVHNCNGDEFERQLKQWFNG